jgi:hypothetical protein
MPVDYFNLTEAQQKAYSKIRKDIQYQESIIKKEMSIKEAASDTYVISRAKKSLAHNIRMLEEHEEEYKKKIQRYRDAVAEAEETLRIEQARLPRNVTAARVSIQELEKELESLRLPQVQESTLTPHVVSSKLPEGFPSREEFMSEGFDEEEAIRRSRARREQQAPEKKQEPVNYDSSCSESEEALPVEKIQKMDRYQPESQAFPPTITNTKTKKPVKQVLKQ